MRMASTFILVAPVLIASAGAAFAHAYFRDAAPPAGDANRLAIEFALLPAGTYTVVWHAASVDTHKTDGTYRFTLAASEAAGISLEHARARASAGNATTGAVYLTLTDHGQPDQLVGASTPIAATAELHETINDNGVMKMRPLARVVLDPGKPVIFKPGGYHVILTGVKAPLKAGDSFPLTLPFAHAQPIIVAVKVEAAGVAGMGHDNDSMEGMHNHMDTKP